MEFTHNEGGAKGLFELFKDGECIANMTYSRIDANNIIVNHTAVHPSQKGKGTGKRIVSEMVAWCRANDQKVLVLCPFTKGVIERIPEYQDILRK